MKKLYLLLVTITIISSCGKEETPDPPKKIATPSLSWTATNAVNDVLEIEITISSNENLPQGKLEFKIDNNTIDTFSPTKGTQSYTTSFKFEDTDEHTATVYYSFNDGRAALSKNKKIQKNTIENIETSSKDQWNNY